MANLSQQPWFAGPVSREDCDSLLLRPGNPPNAFLVRASSTPGAYVMSCVVAGKVTHFRIGQAGGMYFVVTGEHFPSIVLLIDSLMSVGFTSKGRYIKVNPMTISGTAPMRGGQAPPPVPTSARPSVGSRPPAVPSTPRPASGNFSSPPPVPNTDRPTRKASTLPIGSSLPPASSTGRPRGFSDSQPPRDNGGAYGRVNMAAPASSSNSITPPSTSARPPVADPMAGVTYGAAVKRTGDATLPRGSQAPAPPPAASTNTYGQAVAGQAPVAHDPEGDYCDVRQEMPVGIPGKLPRGSSSHGYEGLAARSRSASGVIHPTPAGNLPGSYEKIEEDELPPIQSIYMNMDGDTPLGAAGAPAPASAAQAPAEAEVVPIANADEDYTTLAAPGTFKHDAVSVPGMYVNHSIVQQHK
eukprot:m.48537 g.48537  ORF g.48537 m.48537 type:complete len:412 (+) comp13292_c0_seq1:132-1367(+)